jgi:diacylglycerol O-acyltransferase
MSDTDFAPSMSHNDSVMWTIERDPELRSTITAVILLDRPPDTNRLRQRVEDGVRAIPRLRQRVAGPPLGIGTPRWVDDPFPDLDYHLRRIAAPEGGDIRWLLDFAASLAEAGFDRSRPLWEFVVVEGVGDGGAAFVQKIHHSFTDGIGGVELMMGLLDQTRKPRRAPSVGSGFSSATSTRPQWSPWLTAGIRSAMRDPLRAPATLWRTAGSLGRLVAPGGSRRSPVLRLHRTGWRFDVLDLPLDTLRRAGAAASGTVNDAFLAAIAGGLHRYHLKHGADVPGLRLTLPVSLRGAADHRAGNRFTPVRFVLPIDEPDPATRIRQVGRLCRQWRHEPALPLTDVVAAVLDALPPRLTTAVMGSLLKGVDVVATNVPGIPFRCYLAGAEMLRQYGFAPLSGAALNIALISHAGTACVGVNMDRAAVTDPEMLLACLTDGFGEVGGLAPPRSRRPS